ncbi:aminoglycoside phosphotransferase family protein [Devosia sp.]|uniref:aminoglycoside phosphotransferase family protein n=1 Tax=Devosia sp. TaxID=1871048 RepID=UPI0026096CEC|nr:aminoglycoside phosphotransferase family protein [Devosia sp.]
MTDRIAIDEALVRRLVRSQFPHWADLPIRRVAVDGWDNSTFHLGDTMKVRLPNAPGYAAQAAKELHWLPRLAPLLPVPIPSPVAIGEPGEGYPLHWSIYHWIDGETALAGPIGDHVRFARDIGKFLLALQAIDATGGPPAGRDSFFRGGDLSVYDGETRQCLAELEGQIDVAAAAETWDAALAAEWRDPPVWVHGDIAPGNLLVRDGRLSAVLDFGCSAVGDPACDLVMAWTFFGGAGRAAFIEAVEADTGTWARARGWALWKALLLRVQYSNPQKQAAEERIISAVVEHHRRAR